MSKPTLIERISGLLAKASGRPWTATVHSPTCVYGDGQLVAHFMGAQNLALEQIIANAELCMAVVNAAPALMDALAAAKEMLQAWDDCAPMGDSAEALRSKLAALEEL